jgi:hypothetical protein
MTMAGGGALCGGLMLVSTYTRTQPHHGETGNGNTKTAIAALSWSLADLLVYEHTVGGHGELLQSPDGDVVLKQLPETAKGERERLFYTHSRQDLPLTLQAFVPVFQGTAAIDGKTYLCLSNATQGFVRPSVIDVKMGTHTHSPYASDEKKEAERAKYALQEALGLRVTGGRVWSGDSCLEVGKTQGRAFSEADVCALLHKLVHTHTHIHAPAHTRATTKALLRDQLSALRSVLGAGDVGLRMYASSLLLVVESSAAAAPRVRVRMIDFAHTYSTAQLQQDGQLAGEGKCDEGYVRGVDTLLAMLSERENGV